MRGTDAPRHHHRYSRRRRRSRRAAWAMLSLPLAAVALYAMICLIAFLVMRRPARHFDATNNPGRFGVSYQEVRFRSRSGDVRVAAWQIPAAGSDRALVLVPGKDSSRSDELDGHFPELAAALARRGFNVLMIDLRGHGQSDAAPFGFGPDEKRDVEGAVDFLKTQGFRAGSIGVLGVSLGAAAGIYAAADDPDIGALVEDSSYAALGPILQRDWQGATRLPEFFLPGTELIDRWIDHRDVTTIVPADQIARIAPRPVMIVHGAIDGLIPVQDAYDLAAADPLAAIWIVPQAVHAGAYQVKPDAYVNRVSDFFSSALGHGSDASSANDRPTGLPSRRQSPAHAR